jgi:hypothetical protein
MIHLRRKEKTILITQNFFAFLFVNINQYSKNYIEKFALFGLLF